MSTEVDQWVDLSPQIDDYVDEESSESFGEDAKTEGDGILGLSRNEDAGGEREIMEVISLTIMLPGDIEPNVELGHLLELRRQLARVRACLATLPRGLSVSFGVSLGSGSSNSSSHSDVVKISQPTKTPTSRSTGVDEAEYMQGPGIFWRRLTRMSRRCLWGSGLGGVWARQQTTSFIGGKKRKMSLMRVLEGEDVLVKKRRKAHAGALVVAKTLVVLEAATVPARSTFGTIMSQIGIEAFVVAPPKAPIVVVDC
ncbi:hypothetical protein V6N12_013209 [Hibiscus sabdariffa]|uniref:Uncharacterized protein n=1 Tax=Hibiscus sabdariffa TaxID=183260 RepID=A0ABR2D8M5_9ROSI